MPDVVPDIKLYELGPTRSARCRWALLEAGLEFESIGNAPAIIHSEELRAVHPLGKLPAALINGQPLFESAAIATAIADLVPELNLIARPGSWARNLHNQWVCYVLSELEPFVQSTEINSIDFVIPKSQHVPNIIEQNNRLFKLGATGLEAALSEADYLVENRFTVTDVIVGYTVNFGDEQGLIGDFPNLQAYLERLFAREYCTLQRHESSGAESHDPIQLH